MTNEELLSRLADRWSNHSPRKFIRTGLREAAVLIAISEEQGELSLLLTRRTTEMPTHKGEVAFPGGKREQYDADHIATALREAEEEVGLDPSRVRVIGELDQVISKFGFLVTPVLAVIPHDVELVADSRELDCMFRVPLSFFSREPDEYFQRDGIVMPTWRYEKFRIWGLTAYMIAELMNRYFDASINVGRVAAASQDSNEE
ncbi:NUDIX hydrolase [Oceanobacter mangrovi]|uniref:NUDIX hydrolase n=1 Tax=Oceanobacter mangrovi TaxID=2862510 RepID=UPI001C8DA81D|nr:CoA pyrophosphatase [Oceanobacter mangrovi]